ncbi:hypothetical protein P3X46_018238, partial [Hevea brasiliensis]
EQFKRKMYAKFMVIDIPFSYNAILRRPVLSNHGIIINMEMPCLKLPAVGGITVAQGSKKFSLECYR